MATRLYEHAVFLEHHTPAGHPERADRLRSLNIAVTAAMVLGEAMRQLRHSPDPSEAIGEEPP